MKGRYLADRDMVKRIHYLRQSAREFLLVRAPVILASALVWILAQMLGFGLPACILGALVTQLILFTLAQL